MVGDRKAGSQFRFLRILEGLLRREREQPSPRTCQAAPRHSSRECPSQGVCCKWLLTELCYMEALIQTPVAESTPRVSYTMSGG